jgi:hypothetical protein
MLSGDSFHAFTTRTGTKIKFFSSYFYSGRRDFQIVYSYRLFLNLSDPALKVPHKIKEFVHDGRFIDLFFTFKFIQPEEDNLLHKHIELLRLIISIMSLVLDLAPVRKDNSWGFGKKVSDSQHCFFDVAMLSIR